MLRINQIKLPIDHDKKQLDVKIRKILKLNKDDRKNFLTVVYMVTFCPCDLV